MPPTLRIVSFREENLVEAPPLSDIEKRMDLSMCGGDNLGSLILADNKITKLAFNYPYHHIRFITQLDLSNNQLTDIDSSSLLRMRKLKVLNLSHNQLTTIPMVISQLEELRSVDVSHNRIERLSEHIAHCVNLVYLNVNQNPLQYPPAHIANKGTRAIIDFFTNCSFRSMVNNQITSDMTVQLVEQDKVIGMFYGHCVILLPKLPANVRDDVHKSKVLRVEHLQYSECLALLEYLYTGIFSLDNFVSVFEKDCTSALKNLQAAARKLDLKRLDSLCNAAMEGVANNANSFNDPFFNQLIFNSVHLNDDFDYSPLFNKNLQSDVCLVVGDRKFFCHKVILACRNPYFNCMFSCGFGEAALQEIPLETGLGKPVEALLFFLYQGLGEWKKKTTKYSFTENFNKRFVHPLHGDTTSLLNFLLELLSLAHMYTCESLRLTVQNELIKRIDVCNAPIFLETADLYSAGALYDASFEYLTQNLPSRGTSEYQEMDKRLKEEVESQILWSSKKKECTWSKQSQSLNHYHSFVQV